VIQNNIETISKIRNISMDDDWYEIADSSHFWLEWRLLAMIKQANNLKIPLNKNLKVLEVGCGTGTLRKSIEAKTNWDIDAADLNINALSVVDPGRGKILLYDIFDENESFIESYDIVILYDVLEHIEKTRPFIDSLLKHLKPNGYLLINVPAINSLYSVYDEKIGHFRRYNKKSLINEFKDKNLNILDIRYWGLLMLPLLVIRYGLMIFNKKNDSEIVKKGFKPPSQFINKIFRILAKLETMVFNKPILGTSLLLVGQKQYE
jgi:2-polyprenyl-3-methyl-5-hydroxy-6-metoxy-1,4-benzoquinol methylase